MRVTDAAEIAYSVAAMFANEWHLHGGKSIQPWRELPERDRIDMVVDMNRLLEMDQPYCGDSMGDTLVAIVACALKPHLNGKPVNLGRLTEIKVQ